MHGSRATERAGFRSVSTTADHIESGRVVTKVGLVALLLSGCAEVPREEYAWQALHLVDTAQTVQIARSSHNCFHENQNQSGWLIGENPTVAGALTWGLGYALGHAYITKLMVEHDWPQWIQQTWQITTVGAAAYDVKNNFDQGIGVTGSDCP
jgi:hypothetical protein